MGGVQIKGIENKKMWAVFCPDGNLQVRSLSYHKNMCKALMLINDETWDMYAAAGYVVSKVLVDIKILD